MKTYFKGILFFILALTVIYIISGKIGPDNILHKNPIMRESIEKFSARLIDMNITRSMDDVDLENGIFYVYNEHKWGNLPYDDKCLFLSKIARHIKDKDVINVKSYVGIRGKNEKMYDEGTYFIKDKYYLPLDN